MSFNTLTKRVFITALLMSAILTISPRQVLSQTRSGCDSLSANSLRAELEEIKKQAAELEKAYNPLGGEKIQRYGFSGGLNFNFHNAKFKALDSSLYPCCAPGEYGQNMSLAYYLGGFYDYPLFSDLSLGLFLGINNLSGKLIQTEKIDYSDNGDAKTVDSEHSIDAAMNSIAIAPNISFRPMNELSIVAGMNFSYIFSNSFEQKEELINAPAGYTWENNSTIRNERSGEIPNLNKLQMFASAGVNYEFTYNLTKDGKFFLAPEIKFGYPLTKITSALDWSLMQLSAGIAVKFTSHQLITEKEYEEQKYNFNQKTEELAKKIDFKEKDSTNCEKIKINFSAEITGIMGLREDGSEYKLDTIYVDQKSVSRTFPLLNYIFFDEGSSELSARYKQTDKKTIEEFKESGLSESENIDIYYNILNIIGSRMRKKFDSNIRDITLTLTGCNSNEGKEQNNLNLSESRARAVKKYLTEVWKINEKHIKIEKMNLPEKPTTNPESQGIEENRRVELSCNDKDILKPVEFDSVIYSDVYPNTIRTYQEYFAGSARGGLRQWQINIQNDCGGNDIKKDSAKKYIPKYVDWDIENEKKAFKQSCRLKFNLKAFPGDYGSEYKAGTKNIELKVNSVKERLKKNEAGCRQYEYTILLPFDDPGLDENSKEILKEIKKDAEALNEAKREILIAGFTDKLGGSKKNEELAKNRAKKVAEFLNYSDIMSSGEGVSEEYSNETPEGRFYNRSVKVSINVK